MNAIMTNHNLLGLEGEQLAAKELEKKGYVILERNWRLRHKEIDIIALRDNILVIVEVKSRSNTYFELPQDAVTLKKQRFIIETADAYVQKKNIGYEVRFDVISIVFDKTKTQIEHIEDAFAPML